MSEPIVEYFRMGGYALYVWGSYAVVFVVLAFNLVAPCLRLRRVRRAIASEIRFAEDPEYRRDDDDPLLDASDPSGSLSVAGAASPAPAATIRTDGPRDTSPR